MEPQTRSVTEHMRSVLALVTPLPVRRLDLEAALGAVLAADVRATVSVPPFDSSAMDGYAVRLADLPSDGGPVTLRVTGDIAAGSVVSDADGADGGDGADGLDGLDGADAPGALGPGQAVRIMTGAQLPQGADAVIPVEHTSTGAFVAGAARAEESVTLARRPRPHVRAAGEDVRDGDLLAHAGTEVTAALVGASAASGTVTVQVRRRPLVAVISTGAELVPVGGALGPGQITDSNGPMLAAAARAAGADVVRLGPVSDDPAALRAALDGAVRGAGAGADLIVTAGGVSAGAADVVREVLAATRAGADGEGEVTDVDLASVAMAPGKPQALARWRGVPWLALPGNPVGAYVSFELFARPAIDRLRGRDGAESHHLWDVGHSASPSSTQSNTPPGVSLAAAAEWSGSPGRLLVVPVRLVRLPDGGAFGVVPVGSHHSLSALATADGLALVPPDVEKVRTGDPLRVLMLR